MAARRRRIQLDRTTRAEQFALGESGTSHLVVIDADGNVASVTSSIGDMFGARIESGGFVLNTALADFTPPHLDLRYAPNIRPNTPRGGARPVTSMTPTIVVRDGRAVLALGGSGGTRIPAAVTQVLLGRLAFGQTAEAAIATRRIDAPPEGGLLLDPDAPSELEADLRRRGELVLRRPDYGAITLIAVDPSAPRRLDAAVDPRKGGAALLE
jgi:gamma-glutamyltranspeptidase/glutathione hydrolase